MDFRGRADKNRVLSMQDGDGRSVNKGQRMSVRVRGRFFWRQAGWHRRNYDPVPAIYLRDRIFVFSGGIFMIKGKYWRGRAVKVKSINNIYNIIAVIGLQKRI